MIIVICIFTVMHYLLLANVFENFRNKYIAHFLSAPRLAWQACLKKTEVKLEFLTDINMLLMFEKKLEVEYVMQYIGMQKQILSIWKIMNYSVFKCKQFVWMGNVSKIAWRWKKILKFNEDFIKRHDEDSDKGYILEADVKYPKNLTDLHSD